MIYTYTINGIPVQTGDIICTMNGKPNVLPGEFWRLVGRLVPGDVDHIAMYLGPDGRCVEAGALGVSLFEIHDGFNNGVEVSSLDASYWRRRLVCARRVTQESISD